MAGVEHSLLQLQRLIAGARKEGSGGGESDSDKEHDSKTSKVVRVAKLARQFARLEAELFRQQGLQDKARELHQRAERRRREQQGQGQRGLCQTETVPVEESRNRAYAAMGAGDAEAGSTSREFSSPGSSSLNGAATLLRQEAPTRDAQQRLNDASYVGEAENSCRVYGACHRTNSAAHLLVNLTDGTTRLQGIGVGCGLGNNKDAMLRASARCVPSYSFAQAYAGDDRKRLIFIVDQLSRILREERRQKEVLLLRVVDPMVRQIEALERELARQRCENAALRQETERRVDSRQALGSSGVGRSEKTDSGGEDDRVLTLLQYCEEQLLRLTELRMLRK
ncbi:hypothetical protein TraAM80_03570 [Trypanosoma rangeli]|uniref:Uncharacterized protein n=1 Tax=Trypanosoma rangeli TaxID=5698 RepID=A0A422NNN1_TRYRA|nr:uncharacterized protein TraAM80_03570 [Trypanosoma rangeli]RNF07083.1 hypothetical protein TraAM80_03570 [Trypanosoma rangeli]|eukprot:RNF07083.1 hypothetical protein TraAM80_03570 [Trypanosoma rangeli]